MSTVGFIGLGTMGRPMAKNLIKAGHSLVVYARKDDVAAERGEGVAGVPESAASAPEHLGDSAGCIRMVGLFHSPLHGENAETGG